MIKRLFKYATTDTARAILRTRTLRWSAPELFNDPFEFKSPLELGFEWEDFEQPYLEEASKVITQPDEPALVEGNPVAEMVRKARTTFKGANPVDVQRRFRLGLPGLIDRFRRTAELDREIWRQMKKDYRVLCFSAVRPHEWSRNPLF